MRNKGYAAQQFTQATRRAVAQTERRAVIRRNIGSYHQKVAEGKRRYANWAAARDRAAARKQQVLAQWDRYLEAFEANVIANGGRVHWAETAEEARRIVLAIARQHGVRSVVKSKSMVTEEIHLNAALEQAGIEVVETDLGEYVCQLRGEPPFHIVTPIMHLSRQEVAVTFRKKLQVAASDRAEELTQIARQRLRAAFLRADMGITGANFLIAETGQIAITENEGNARLCFSGPPVHVVLAGIEKLLPTVSDLALFWPLLATSGTGQSLTVYNSLIAGPRAGGELHVVLVDNGRTRLFAAGEQREALRCIRCGACLNICPIYQNVGGHSYGTTYQGPVGSVITPWLRDDDDWSHLSYASSLCGACTDVCPVGIHLHHHLLANRRDAVARGRDAWWQRVLFRGWLWVMQSPERYRWAGRLATWAGAVGLRGPRGFPMPVRRTFRDWWSGQR
ncbi:MAG: lactate utilization protein B [Verrucomicrobiae bacterium]|nr:lactate utilization protein B [Verrucomicrobiae bacterium]